MRFGCFITLVFLKLTSLVTFSWWWVWLPLVLVPLMWLTYVLTGLAVITTFGVIARIFGISR
jgi:hypothetical protein